MQLRLKCKIEYTHISNISIGYKIGYRQPYIANLVLDQQVELDHTVENLCYQDISMFNLHIVQCNITTPQLQVAQTVQYIQ